MTFLGIPIEIGTVSALGIIGVLSLLIVGQLVTRGNERHKRDIENFNKSAAVFRNAFATEISLLGSSVEGTDLIRINAFKILSSAIPKHEGAISLFKTGLTERECARLEKAWRDYLYPDGDSESSPCPLVDFMNDGQEHLEVEARHLARQKIGKLLKVAKNK